MKQSLHLIFLSLSFNLPPDIHSDKIDGFLSNMALVLRGSDLGAGQQLYYALKLKESKTTASCAGTTLAHV